GLQADPGCAGEGREPAGEAATRRSTGLGERQGEPELGATTLARCGPDTTAEALDDPLARGQPDPEAGRVASRRLGSVEGGEELLHVSAVEPDAPIEHEQLGLRLGRLDDDLDRRPGRAVLDGVGQEVLEDEAEVRPVRLDDEVARLTP